MVFGDGQNPQNVSVIHKLSNEINKNLPDAFKITEKITFLTILSAIIYGNEIILLFMMHLYSHRSDVRNVETNKKKVYLYNFTLNRSFLMHLYCRIALPRKRKTYLKCFYLKNVDICYPNNRKPYICVIGYLRVNKSCAYRTKCWPKQICEQPGTFCLSQNLIFFSTRGKISDVWYKQSRI